MSSPDKGYYLEEVCEALSLEEGQVRRAIQFFVDNNIIDSHSDPWSGVGRVGAKKVVYALTKEAHRKVSKQKKSKI